MGFTTPLEFGINFVYIAFLVAECFYGFKVFLKRNLQAAKGIAIAQTNQFFLQPGIDQSNEMDDAFPAA